MIVEIKFDTEELQFLRRFVGSIWESIASPSFNAAGSLALMDVVLRSDKQTLTLTADDWQPEGTEGAYSRLSLSSSIDLYGAAERSGGLYFQYRGEPVEDVLIVVDTVKVMSPTANAFSLRMDQGVGVDPPSRAPDSEPRLTGRGARWVATRNTRRSSGVKRFNWS